MILSRASGTLLQQQQQQPFHHVKVSDDDGGIEMKKAIRMLHQALKLRQKYAQMMHGVQETTDKVQQPITIRVDDGIMFFSSQSTMPVPWEVFYEDITALQSINSDGLCNASCVFRLQTLEEKFNIHRVLNSNIEDSADPLRRGGGVFGAINRVDNNVRLSASMSAMHLVRCIQEACEHRGFEVVRYTGSGRQVEDVTLRDITKKINLDDPRSLTVEGLGLHPPSEKRFSRFDPLESEGVSGRSATGITELLSVFLTRETANNGRLFADVVRPVVFGLGSASGDQTGTNSVRAFEAAEFSIPVHGSVEDEWESVARWVIQNRLLNTYGRVMWTIEIPRIASRRGDFKHEFQQKQLECIFGPLFLATISPDDPKYADLATFLLSVGAFYITSDEEARRGEFTKKRRPPRDVPWQENPCDLYFAYYVWANLVSLNAFRRRKGLNTFQLRFAAGERSTQLDSILLAYLLCDNISHGVLLKEHPVLQYLYGYHKIGLFMSPLTNNAMDISYLENPFPSFFRRGLTVTLCSDSPLHHHHHDRALLEEYGTASKIYKLSPVDMAEIARTSVLLSAFSTETKLMWTGEHFADVARTCVPHMRLILREESWRAEKELIGKLLTKMDGMYFMNNSYPSADFLAITIDSPAIILDGAGAADSQQHSQQQQQPPSSGIDGNGNGNSTLQQQQLQQQLVVAASGGASERSKMVTFHEENQQSPYHQRQQSRGESGGVPSGSGVAFPRLHLVGPPDRDTNLHSAAQLLKKALDLRVAYVMNSRTDQKMDMILQSLSKQTVGATVFDKKSTNFDESSWVYQMVEGVFVNHGKQNIPRIPLHLPKYNEFAEHIKALQDIAENRLVKYLAFRRLNLLEHKYRLHHAISHSTEAGSTMDKVSQNRDFYQTTKVDTAVRMETGMTSRQLLNFIIAKAQNSGDDIVSHRSGEEPQTLRQLLKELKIDPAHLTVDDLNVQADNMLVSSSDQFRQEGRDPLLTLLLKTRNEMNGRYFAELTKLTFDQFQRDRYTFSENRLTIYGANENEWDQLSNWFDTHGMACYNNEWMIQFPRIYGYLRKMRLVANFAQYLSNLFDKLWKVSLNPAERPRLFHFLNHVTGFDCVEDERREDVSGSLANLPPPQKWTSEDDPPYNYYMYYLWVNIRTLNEFRTMRNFSTYSFRPSCGEGGTKDHLLGGFLVSNAINYGVALNEDPSIQYLFYLAQIGVSVSPLSNNMKALEYLKNPFPSFFRRGLNVSLSTDSPLQVHHTQEPLIEEYSVASKVWKLSPTDMCEIARNSVLHSGFSQEFKQKALGEYYFLSSSRGNDSKVTHLSDVRVAYRYETYHNEFDLLDAMAGTTNAENNRFPRAMFMEKEEDLLIEKVSKHSAKTADAAAARGGIIVASTDEAEIARMRNQRAILSKQLTDSESQLESLKIQNRKLFDSYNEAVAKEAALEHSKQGIAQLVEAASRRMARSRAAMTVGGTSSVNNNINSNFDNNNNNNNTNISPDGSGDGSATPTVGGTSRSQSRATFSRQGNYNSITNTSAAGNKSTGVLVASNANANSSSSNNLLQVNSSTGTVAVAGRESTIPEMLHAAVPASHLALMEAERSELSPAQSQYLRQKTILEGSEAIFGRDSLFARR